MTEGSERIEPRSVAELFAGVGGFRLGLERSGWKVVWSNQWEPTTKTVQHASDVYVYRFGKTGHTSDDISHILDLDEAGTLPIPRVSLLCGGFPCQDYSVAKPLSQAAGIRGQKGVLWWEIHRFLERKEPDYLLLENVDRLLKSPSTQRGRDFAVMLSCLARLDYVVEWRVVNAAADYGYAQRRRRVFIVGYKRERGAPVVDPWATMHQSGVLARALRVRKPSDLAMRSRDEFELPEDPYAVSEGFGCGVLARSFLSGGVMTNGMVYTSRLEPLSRRRPATLRDVVEDGEVPAEFYVEEGQRSAWETLKGPKKAAREKNGFKYHYSEGGVAFPDPLDRPSRTILTGEGGSTPSRFKHVIETSDGRLRRLVPRELERLNGFPPDWTRWGETIGELKPARRAFLMGNALVVDIVRRIGGSLRQVADECEANDPHSNPPLMRRPSQLRLYG